MQLKIYTLKIAIRPTVDIISIKSLLEQEGFDLVPKYHQHWRQVWAHSTATAICFPTQHHINGCPLQNPPSFRFPQIHCGSLLIDCN